MISCSVTKLNNEFIIVTSTIESNQIKVRFFEYQTGNEITDMQMTEKWPSYRGYPKELRVLAFKKRDGTTSVRIFIIADDLSLSMLIKNGSYDFFHGKTLDYQYFHKKTLV